MSAASPWTLRREAGVATLVHANPPRHTLSAAGVAQLHAQLDALEQQEFARTMRSRDAAGALRAFLRGERWEWKGE